MAKKASARSATYLLMCAGSMSTTTTAPRRPPRLVLHFDLNETIMVTDAAGGDDFSACLNKMVAKSIFQGDFKKLKHGDGQRCH